VRLRIAATVLAAMTLAGCTTALNPVAEPPGVPSASSDASASPSAEPGPFDFTAAKVGGGELDGASLKGRDVVLWFWAPWCPTCMVEGRDHVSAAIAQLPEGVELIGIAGLSDDQAAIEEFVEWTGTGGADHVVDEDGAIWEGFGVVLQPAFYFVNDDGTFHRAGAGLTAEDILAEAAWLAES
jgi:thiol-disulfide isomerase/thioredoxin